MLGSKLFDIPSYMHFRECTGGDVAGSGWGGVVGGNGERHFRKKHF